MWGNVLWFKKINKNQKKKKKNKTFRKFQDLLKAGAKKKKKKRWGRPLLQHVLNIKGRWLFEWVKRSLSRTEDEEED